MQLEQFMMELMMLIFTENKLLLLQKLNKAIRDCSLIMWEGVQIHIFAQENPIPLPLNSGEKIYTRHKIPSPLNWGKNDTPLPPP